MIFEAQRDHRLDWRDLRCRRQRSDIACGQNAGVRTISRPNRLRCARERLRADWIAAISLISGDILEPIDEEKAVIHKVVAATEDLSLQNCVTLCISSKAPGITATFWSAAVLRCFARNASLPSRPPGLRRRSKSGGAPPHSKNASEIIWHPWLPSVSIMSKALGVIPARWASIAFPRQTALFDRRENRTCNMFG